MNKSLHENLQNIDKNKTLVVSTIEVEKKSAFKDMFCNRNLQTQIDKGQEKIL